MFAQDDKKEKEESPEPVKQEKKVSPPKPTVPVSLRVSRRTLTNFLTERVALLPYRMEDSSLRPFRGAFVIDSPQSDFAVIWHHESCRVVGVVNLHPVPVIPKSKSADVEKGSPNPNPPSEKEADKLEPPSPYVIKASGHFPLALVFGGAVEPRYFGFRMIGDRPEFLYNMGNITVEECIWLDASGKKMLQRFRLGNRDDSDLKLSFPESWKERIEASKGEWKDSVLTIPETDAAEFVLTYRLTEKEPAKESTEKEQ